MRWKLTLSYTTVTVGSLLFVVIILGYLVFSTIFMPPDLFDSVFTPQEWIRIISENDSPLLRTVLLQEPIDTRLVSELLQEGELQISHIDLQIGDFKFQLGTVGQGTTILVDPCPRCFSDVHPGFVNQPSTTQFSFYLSLGCAVEYRRYHSKA